MNKKLNRYIRHLLFIVLGAGAGYLLNLLIGCPTGTCAITSNPYPSMAYMALAGWLILISLFISGKTAKTE